MPLENSPAIFVSGLTKRYVGDDQIVVANDNIDFTVGPGSLHAIVGENGAGKSTLAHALSGLVHPDSGTIEVFGQALNPGDPNASKAAGIGLVAQHFTLVDTLSVWENVVLGDEPSHAGWIDRDAAREAVTSLADLLDLDLSPDTEVGTLPLPTRQGIEIIKALKGDARILILDEPTSVLGPAESGRLFRRIEMLRSSGTTVILVTHRLREVLDHATDVTVLRRGESVATFSRNEFDEPRIIEAIIGKPAASIVPASSPASHEPGPAALSLENVHLQVHGRSVLEGLSLNIRQGEIVGLAGVAGNGQTELASVIAGSLTPSEGRVRFGKTDVTECDTGRRRRSKLAYIPEDRRKSGLVGSFTVRDNLFLGGHQQFGKPWKWDRVTMESAAADLIEEFDIRTPSSLVRVDSLSGGNQQKVVLARELSRDPRVLLAMYPTQGLDLGATAFVHQRLREARSSGCGILIVSNDLDELRQLSDRIAVIYKGRIAGVCDAAGYDEQQIGSWMTSGAM